MSADLFLCNSIANLPDAANWLLSRFAEGRVFAFYGKMGAGKTTLTKVLCEKLNVVDVVNSPTFALINVYNTLDNQSVYHFDFYRIRSISEVFDIGYEDYFYSSSYCFIEWPELVESLLPEGTIRIEIIENEKDGSRLISLKN